MIEEKIIKEVIKSLFEYNESFNLDSTLFLVGYFNDEYVISAESWNIKQ